MRYTRKLSSYETSSHFNQLQRYVIDFYNHYSIQKFIHEQHTKTILVDWHCYECKKPIKVSIRPLLKGHKRFNTQSLFCENHKDQWHKSVNSHVFVRFESSFYQAIKHTIINSINLSIND